MSELYRQHPSALQGQFDARPAITQTEQNPCRGPSPVTRYTTNSVGQLSPSLLASAMAAVPTPCHTGQRAQY
jgi:hypothetical protein